MDNEVTLQIEFSAMYRDTEEKAGDTFPTM